MQLDQELLKKVRLLELQTRRLVNSLFAGEYHSAFKGQGMTFSDFREYVHGDDVRNISWSLTARANKPYIKKYDEERELTLLLVVDISGSGEFGSKKNLKKDVMTQLAAILAFSALKNNDKIGLILFTDEVELYVPPKKGRAHIHRILRDILFFQPKSKKTNIRSATEFIRGVLKKKASIFVFSDFMDVNYEKSLKFLCKKHDVVALNIENPLEIDFPSIGLIEFLDPETQEIVAVDTSSPVFKRNFLKKNREDLAQKKETLKKSQAQIVSIKTEEDFVMPLVNYFRMRKRK